MAGWDGNGSLILPYSWVNDAANGIPITASRMDTQFNTVATTGFGNTVTRDNQGKPSANMLPDTDNAYTFGSSSFRWSAGFFVYQQGTSTNNNAPAGAIGEFTSSNIPVGSAVSLTTNTAADITSLSLTAGDWEVSGNVIFAVGGGTTTTEVLGWTSSTSATVPTAPNEGQFAFSSSPAGLTLGNKRYSLSGTTTVYLSVRGVFAVSTMTAYGYLRARRAR